MPRYLLRLALAFAATAPARGQDAPTIPRSASLFSPAAEAPKDAAPKKESEPAKKKAERAAAKSAAAAAAREGAPPALTTDAKAARTDAQAALKAIPAPTEKQPNTALQKSTRDALEDRLKWLDAFEKAVKDRDAAEHPNPSPEREAADLKGEAERAKAVLDAAVADPSNLLSKLFQGSESNVPEAKLTEMREAIEAIRNEVKEKAAKLEKLRNSTARTANSPLALLQADRDKIAQRVAALPARRTEREKGIEAAKTQEERDLAGLKLLAFEWEAKAENERVHAAEAQISLGNKRSDLTALEAQARDLQLKLAKQSLEAMQARYRALAETQQNSLRHAALTEAKKASDTVDALERYKASKKAEVLELQVALINDKKAHAANPRLSLQEQSQLADRAQSEFESLKALLKDDAVSSLDALQLNNDFRRVTRERDMISRNELSEASAAMAYYENLLTQVELDLLSDTRDDRFELENLLALLPPNRHADARSAVEAREQERRGLLMERRAVLEKLAARAKGTHAQIVRRLKTLDEEYAFVRTNLFWIRDAEPIGISTLREARREARQVAPGVARLAVEPFDARLWSRPTFEFGASMVGAVVMPFVLFYARRALGRIA